MYVYVLIRAYVPPSMPASADMSIPPAPAPPAPLLLSASGNNVINSLILRNSYTMRPCCWMTNNLKYKYIGLKLLSSLSKQ